MSNPAKFYEIFLESADKNEIKTDKVEKQRGHIVVYDDNFTIGYTIFNKEISLLLYGTYIEGIGMMLSTRNFLFDFSEEKRFQTFVNNHNQEYWFGDVFNCNNRELKSYDKSAKSKTIPVYDKEFQDAITQNVGIVLDYIQQNSPETWMVITDTLNGLGNIENRKYINNMKDVYESKDIPDIFKQSQPGNN